MARPTSRRRTPTAKALIELRRRLGETQQSMAERLGCVLQSVARWETSSRPQSITVLAALRDLAEREKHPDLAAVFGKAVDENLSRTHPRIAFKLVDARERLARLDASVSEIQTIAQEMKERGEPDGQRIYDLCNDMWETLQSIHATNWRTK